MEQKQLSYPLNCCCQRVKLGRAVFLREFTPHCVCSGVSSHLIVCVQEQLNADIYNFKNIVSTKGAVIFKHKEIYQNKACFQGCYYTEVRTILFYFTVTLLIETSHLCYETVQTNCRLTPNLRSHMLHAQQVASCPQFT